MRAYLEAWKDRRAFVRRGMVVILCLMGGAAAAAAQPPVTELANPGNATDDQFGAAFALSSDGNTMLVGAPQGTVGGVRSGRVDVYNRQNGAWTQTAELSVPAALTPTLFDNFGASVALSADGTLALVGAPGRIKGGEIGLGAFETFELQGGAWTWTSEVASSAVHQANLGASVALSGDGLTAVVAAPAESNGIGYCGVIHLYTRSSGSWNETSALSAGSACAVSPFDLGLGRSLALSWDGSTVAATVEIMCPDGVPPCGAAHVFVRNGSSWTEQARLAVSNPLYFGQSVSLSGNGSTAAVGGGTGGYIFERSGSAWTQAQRLDGDSMSLSGDDQSLLVGVVGPNGGADLYTRTATGWIKVLRIPDPASPQNSAFGTRVALSTDGATAAVWAPRASRQGSNNIGKVYAVTLASIVDTPTLNGAGLAALAVLLAAAGAFALRRRPVM